MTRRSQLKGFFIGLVVAIAVPALAATFNLFSPANGILKGNSSTYVTTAATSADVVATFSGGAGCTGTNLLAANGTCQAAASGTVTSVGLTMPSGLSVAGSPVTTSGTLAVTTALNGVVHANGSGFTASNVALGSEVSGTLPVANGGTGVATITGPIRGNGTSPFTAAAAADIYGLWSGGCSGSNFLRGDGVCASPGGGGTVTSITAGTGLSASPGNPITSSGTLSLNLANANTWTGVQTFNATAPMVVMGVAEATLQSGQNFNVFGSSGAFGVFRQTTNDVESYFGSDSAAGFSGTRSNHDYRLYANNSPVVTVTAAGGVTLPSATTAGGSLVCRADGTNCPAAGAQLNGTNTWTGSNNFTGSGLQLFGNNVLAYNASVATGTIFANGSGCSVSNPIGMSSSCTRNGLGNYTVAFTSGISASKCTGAISGTITPTPTVFGFQNTFSNLNVGAQLANGSGAVDPAQFHVICIG